MKKHIYYTWGVKDNFGRECICKCFAKNKQEALEQFTGARLYTEGRPVKLSDIHRSKNQQTL